MYSDYVCALFSTSVESETIDTAIRTNDVRLMLRIKNMKMFWITPNFPLSLERSIYAEQPSICRMHTAQEGKKNVHHSPLFERTCIKRVEVNIEIG